MSTSKSKRGQIDNGQKRPFRSKQQDPASLGQETEAGN